MSQKSNLTVELIQIELIKEPEVTMRLSMDETAFKELIDSIKSVGLINPITLAKLDEHYEIIAGVRRYLACKEIGFTHISSVVLKATTREKFMIQAHENYYRADVDPVEEAKYFQAILKISNFTQNQLAKMLNKSDAYISERLAVLEYPDDVKDCLKHDVFGVSVGRELARIDDEKTRQFYLKSAIEDGITPKEAKSYRASYENYKVNPGGTHTKSEPGQIPEYVPPLEIQQQCDICNELKPASQVHVIHMCDDCLKEPE